ncbi:MAG: pseudouridine synthase [Verrucomicrobium sp.]
MVLSRLIAKHGNMGRTAGMHAIATRRVKVDHQTVSDGQHPVDRFSHVTLDDSVVQEGGGALYIMLHKPAGYLSATSDPQHPTVMDLIQHPDRETLHIAGRLDRSSSGLLLLTNDGRWSKALTDPAAKVDKVYVVETAHPIDPGAVEKFAAGFYFHTEDLTTLPAKLEIISERTARVALHEGRYHQIKRMFHRVNNRVVRLHRSSIGPLMLSDELPEGQWRELTAQELTAFT